MNLWHLTADAPRSPTTPHAGQRVCLHAGTWPIELGQSVWASFTVEHGDGTTEHRVQRGIWTHNDGVNSYWSIELGAFKEDDQVRYTVLGESDFADVVTGPSGSFKVAAADRVETPSFEERLAVESSRHPVLRVQ